MSEPAWIVEQIGLLAPYLERVPPVLLLLDEHGGHADYLARYYQRALLCHQPTAAGACGVCRACHLYAQGTHPDAHFHQEKGKIELIRVITQASQHTPMLGARRVIYLAQIDKYELPALNALLKTLETPPAHSYFLLSASRRAAVLPTILSRCQTLRLPLPDARLAMDWLMQQGAQDADYAKMLLDYSFGNPYLAASRIDAPNPLEALPELIAFTQGDTRYLQRLDALPKQHDSLCWCDYQLRLLIRWQQYHQAPIGLKKAVELAASVYNISPVALMRAQSGLAKLRQMDKRQLLPTQVLHIKALFLETFHKPKQRL